MTKLLIILQMGTIASTETYQGYVDSIYKKIAWRFSDQNFLINLGQLYQSLDQTELNGIEGGFWRVLEQRFHETQNIKDYSSFNLYYKSIRYIVYFISYIKFIISFLEMSME